LQETIPHLSRSALHRCFKRNGCSALPKEEQPKRRSFKKYPIGFFHVDIAEVQTAQGKLYLFVGIDRTSKFAFAKLYKTATRHEAATFLKELIDIVPYKINKVLTDNGIVPLMCSGTSTGHLAKRCLFAFFGICIVFPL
jgi:transposase-like protein